jgi:hypothetical protein
VREGEMADMLIDRDFVRAVLTRDADWAWSRRR